MQWLITIAALLVAAACGWSALRARRDQRMRSAARVAALAAAIDPQRSHHDPDLFEERTTVFARGNPLLRAGGTLAVFVALAMVGAVIVGLQQGASSQPDVATPSLALLSMQHDRDERTLTVTGLVRNQGATPASGITAVVSVFDRTGRAMASASAPLEGQPLAPGGESSFRVAIPQSSDVARYRVRFQNEDGVIRHVDRRAPASTAATMALR
jgi:hypothetical protein